MKSGDKLLKLCAFRCVIAKPFTLVAFCAIGFRVVGCLVFSSVFDVCLFFLSCHFVLCTPPLY